LTFIYFRYKSTVTKLITLQVSDCTVAQYYALIFVKYAPYRKLFQMKVVDITRLNILCHEPMFCAMRRFWETRWSSISYTFKRGVV